MKVKKIPEDKKRHRHWFFTFNNYTEDDINSLLTWIKSNKDNKAKFQEEKGENGTPHLQGVISLKDNCTFNAIKQKYPSPHWEVVKNLKSAKQYVMKEATRNGRQWIVGFSQPLRDPLNGRELYPWQKQIDAILDQEPDDRTIIWIYDPTGSMGKTSYLKHTKIRRPFTNFLAGSEKDMFYKLQQLNEQEMDPTAVFINIPRSKQGFVSYGGIEQIKDGLLFAAKFKSNEVMFNPPHVIVLANFTPDVTKFTQDRWCIYEMKLEHELENITDLMLGKQVINGFAVFNGGK